MIYFKIHNGNERVTAICDKELIGKKISEGKLCLDVSKRFYEGELIDEEKLKEVLKDATNLNIVGEKSIKIALKEKVIDEKSIIKIKGIPHAQVYSI